MSIEYKDNIATIDGDVCISSWVRTRGALDWDYQGLANVKKRLDKLNRFGVAIDAGAYIGDYTHTFAQWFDTVLAFEPNREAYDCLLYNAGQPNVHCFNAAIGDYRKSYSFSINHNNPGASQVKDGTDATFLDIGGIRGVDFIKIDVEGSEPGVLLSCEKIIADRHPSMLVEQRNMDGNEEWVWAFLRKHGYEPEVISGDRTVMYDLWCE